MSAGEPGGPDSADKLLSKADALLDRYRRSAMSPTTRELTESTTPDFAAAGDGPPGGPLPSGAADFPVLTEIVELPHSALQPGVPEPEFPPLFGNAAGRVPGDEVAAKLAADATRLREEILATLAPELEQRLSDTLKPRANELLDWAMQTVQLELGLSIRAAVRSAVATAVDEALEKHRRTTNPDKS
jgi:hypothetical protein